MPEYRKIRERVDFVTLCRTPDLVAEVTIQPVDRLGVDAAIPRAAAKAALSVFLTHDSYRIDVAMMEQDRHHRLPDDACTRHLSQVLAPHTENDDSPKPVLAR